MRTKFTLDLIDIISDLRGERRILRRTERGLRAANADLAAKLKAAQDAGADWKRLHGQAREDVTRAQARADELSRDLAQLRTDLRAEHAKGYESAVAELWEWLKGDPGEDRVTDMTRLKVAIDKAMDDFAAEKVAEDRIDRAKVLAEDPDPRQGTPGGTDLDWRSMKRAQQGPTENVLLRAAAPPPAPAAPDPAICTLADLRTEQDGPAEIAVAVDDLRCAFGDLKIERGTVLIVARHGVGSEVLARQATPAGPHPYDAGQFVMATGRVRKTGETHPAQPKAEPRDQDEGQARHLRTQAPPAAPVSAYDTITPDPVMVCSERGWSV